MWDDMKYKIKKIISSVVIFYYVRSMVPNIMQDISESFCKNDR